MRKITGLLFVMTLFVSLSVCNAQTVDEIVNKYVDSLGGAAKIQSIKTVRMEATMSMMGNDIGIVITNSHLVGSRVDISFNGQDGYTIVTPTKGWSYLPFQGQTEPTPMPEEQLKIQQTSLDLQGNLFNYKEKGNQLELQGKEKLDGADCYKIKATLKSGKVIQYWIDAKTYHVSKTASKENFQGTDIETFRVYSNYKKTAEGYIMPFSIVNERGELSISKVEVNKVIDEKIFSVN